MGVLASSFMDRHCDILDLMHMIRINHIVNFKTQINYLDSREVLLLFLEAIQKERKQHFDILVEKFKILSDNLSEYMERGFYEQCFTASVDCSDPYFAMKLLEAYDFIPNEKLSSLLHIAVHVENELISHELILKGADVNSFDIIGQTPLDDAIKSNNLNLVCMLLYYGGYTNHLRNNLTSFMYSIICGCTKDIQDILIDYEADFNITCNDTSTLFFALKYKSPVTLDIIERGADVNYFDGIHNTVSLSMLHDCNPSVFKVIWQKFDYAVWRISYSKAVLIKFLEGACIKWEEYLNIFMENEEKLKLDLEHHNNSYFYKSDLIISTFYLKCLEKHIDVNTIESLVLHLLSHGAHIFKKDIEIIYRQLQTVTPFLRLLLYMDLQSSSDELYSVMYFHYTPVPDIRTYLINTVFPSDVLLKNLKYLRKFYALDGDLKMLVLDSLDAKEVNYEVCRKLLEESVAFPSLLQLSRDSVKKSLCLKYLVNNSSSKLFSVVKQLNLPKYIENILFLNVCLYCFPT